MNTASTEFKLAQLRVKTDRELCQIIDNQLESVLNSAEPRHAKENACAEAVKLLSMVEDLCERRRLKSKLARARESLQRRLTAGESRVQAACP